MNMLNAAHCICNTLMINEQYSNQSWKTQKSKDIYVN